MPSLELITRWLAPWKRKREATALPFGLTAQELQSLIALRDSPQWAHYLRVLERLGEQQAAEVASGLAYDRYVFACGALTALHRVYTLVDDLAASAAKLKEITNDRTRSTADAQLRRSRAFLNTPWYDAWKSNGGGDAR